MCSRLGSSLTRQLFASFASDRLRKVFKSNASIDNVKINRIVGIIFLTVTLFALTVLIFLTAGISFSTLLLESCLLLLVLPLLIRRRLDMFEPVVAANVALGVMFVGRPLADLVTGETDHIGYDVLATFDETLLVALLGILFFQLGYFSPLGKSWSRRLPVPPVFRPRRAAMYGWMFLILGGLMYGTFLIQTGGVETLLSLLSGRQETHNELYLSSTGYFYNGLLMWGVAALIFFAVAVSFGVRQYRIWFLLPFLPLLVLYGSTGGRANLLPIVLAIPIYWYLWKARRPSSTLIIVAALLVISVFGWLREMRSTWQEHDALATLTAALAAPITEAGLILSGADNEMFDSLANELLVVPEELPFQHGSTVIDIFIRAVPRPLWPDKPLEVNDAIVDTLWPEHYAVSRGAPAFSLMGPFYADSGIFTVALGMFLVGTVLSMSWQWLQRHRAHTLAQLIYSMGLPFVVILMRGTIPDTLARMLFLMVPLVAFMLLLRIRGRNNRGIALGTEPPR